MGIILIVTILVGNLLINHTRIVLKETGTIDDMGVKDENFNFGKIRNIKFIFSFTSSNISY